MRFQIKLVLTLLLAVFVAGCKDTVHSNLPERDANEIVAVLYTKGITAAKEPVKDGLFSVSVSQMEFSAAVAILSQAGLPRESFNTIGDVFPDDNVVGTPFEERARFSFALSQELSETLTEIEGVKYARVHIVIPEKGRFEDKAPPSKAALAIYHKSDFDPIVHLAKMKMLVAYAVPNLTYDDVSVSLFPAGGLTDVVIEPAAPSLAASAAVEMPAGLSYPQGDTLVAGLFLSAVFLMVCVIALRLCMGVCTLLGRLTSRG